MSHNNPSARDFRKGMKVRVVFEGEVASDSDTHTARTIWLKPETTGEAAQVLSWSKNHDPDIEILDPGYEDGDVGVWTGCRKGTKVNVVFRRFNAHGSEGWYNVANGEFVTMPDSRVVKLVLRADGSLVEGVGV